MLILTNGRFFVTERVQTECKKHRKMPAVPSF